MQSARRIDAGLTHADSLAAVIASHLDGSATVNDVARAYYADTRVTRLIAHACYKSRLPTDFCDELLQELVLLLTQKFLASIVDPEKIYNVLHVSACNIARRKSTKATEDSLDAILERDGDPDPTTSSLMADLSRDSTNVDEQIDRRRAIAELGRRMSAKMGTEQGNGANMQLTTSLRMTTIDTQPLIVTRTARIKPPKAVTPASEGGIELSDIRQQLGYTVPEFAKVLNITKGTLSSYLYGIVKNVPDSVLKEARLLKSQSGNAFQEIAKKFENLTMEAIVTGWCVQLGIGIEDERRDTHLAEKIGVDRATVWRWRCRNMRPELKKLKEYDDLVNAASKKAVARS